MATFPQAIAPGNVLVVTDVFGNPHTYVAQGHALPGEKFVQAVRHNPAMPSGWECADVLLMDCDRNVVVI